MREWISISFSLIKLKMQKIFLEEYRNDSFKVSGCQAQVWLVPIYKEKILSFIMTQMHLFLKAWLLYYATYMEEEIQMKLKIQILD